MGHWRNSSLLGLILPTALLAAWWWTSANSQSPYFPPLSRILSTFADTWFFAQFYNDLLPSVLRLCVGFGIAVICGVVLGIVLGLSRRLRQDLLPLTEFLRSMPIAALVPLGFIFLGPGSRMEISLIAFGSFWPIFVATVDGVRGVDPLMAETGRIYGLSRVRSIFVITLPAASPQIAAGIRIALAIGIATMIVANIFGSSSGLGNFVLLAQQSFDVLGTWAGLLMIGLIGVVFNGLYLFAQHRALAWHRGWRRSTEA
jgi:sulfonate transport system permease protein